MSARSSQSILLVDDDPHTCAIFEMLMEHYDIPHLVARNAPNALQVLQEYQPNIIIIDLFLPGTDGFQMMRQIRERIDSSLVRILATTAYYTKDTRRDVIARGFDGYVPKPFLPDTFIPFLREPGD